MRIKKIKLVWVIYIASLLFVVGILVYRYSTRVAFGLLAILAALYLLVAISHHIRQQNFKLEIIIEYILIALLAVVMFQGLIN